jgi:Uma2 family endonuclease
MSTVSARPPSQKLLLHGIDWPTYSRLVRAFAGRRGLRLSYDRGTLEIMTLRYGHESLVHLLGRFVVALTEELNLPIAEGDSTTFRRRRSRRGLEPDQSYWIASEPLVRGKQRIDLRVDPPPDLAIEVDVLNSSVSRMGIYAALGVPEVWRLVDPVLAFHVLAGGGQYAVCATSRAFGFLTSTDMQGFLALRGQQEENATVRQFRAWVRQRQTP